MDDMDGEPTIEQLSKDMAEMASWKAPASEDIPADLLCQCNTYLLPLLHDILVKYWRKDKVLEDMRNVKNSNKGVV